jgi:hypothetical protein
MDQRMQKPKAKRWRGGGRSPGTLGERGVGGGATDVAVDEGGAA